MELVRFTNSGTEANLLAISTAIAATGRKKVLVFRDGYHGAVFIFSPGANINAPFDFVFGTYNDADATVAPIETHKPPTWRRSSSSRCWAAAAAFPPSRRSSRRCARRPPGTASC